MKDGQTLGVLFAPGQPARTLSFPKPDWQAGDARYLEPGSTRRLELRPLLIEEMAVGYTYRPGTWMLIIRGASGAKLRACVALPSHLRKNTQYSAASALKRLLRASPESARMIDIIDTITADPQHSLD